MTGGAWRFPAPSGGRGGRGREPPHRRLDLLDVLRRRAAAPADDAHVVQDEPARVRGHVFGRAEIDVAALDVPGLAGVGLRRQAALGDGLHSLDGLEHRRGTDGAVDADHGRATPFELGSEALGRRAVERVAVLFGRHLRDDRQVGDLARRVDGGADFVQIAERFQDEQIDAALDERLGLFAKVLARLVDTRLAPWLDPDAERADRPGDVGILPCRAAGDSHAFDVDGVKLLAQAERPELDAIGAECIRLEDVGAGAHVFLVHGEHDLRLREVQRVEALVDEHALRVQHRPHCAVADEDSLLERVDECCHLVIWSSGHR